MSASDTYFEISQYLARFWEAMDACDYPAVVNGLTPDCRWLRDRWREGRADILEALEARPPLAASRHNIVNLIIEDRGDQVTCRYGLIIFGQARSGDADAPPYRTSGPRMGDWNSTLVKIDGQWFATEIGAELIFDRL